MEKLHPHGTSPHRSLGLRTPRAPPYYHPHFPWGRLAGPHAESPVPAPTVDEQLFRSVEGQAASEEEDEEEEEWQEEQRPSGCGSQ